MASHLDSQAGDFRNSAGNKRRLRIISVAQTVGDSCRKRHHIFQCRADFNSQYIRACIHTEHFIHKNILNIFRCFLIPCSRHNDGGQPLAYFFRVGRAGKYGDLSLGHFFFNDLGKRHQGVFFDSFGNIDNNLPFVHNAFQLSRRASCKGRRYCEHQQILSFHRSL